MSSVSESGSVARQLARLKASRTAKKGIITKRIRQIEMLVAEGGKRKVIARLMDALQVVYAELHKVCDEISSISDDFDELNSIELIRLNVETCLAEAAANLDDRRDEPPSSGSVASMWVRDNFDERGIAKTGGDGFGTPEEGEGIVQVAAAISRVAEVLREDYAGINTSEEFHSIPEEDSEKPQKPSFKKERVDAISTSAPNLDVIPVLENAFPISDSNRGSDGVLDHRASKRRFGEW